MVKIVSHVYITGLYEALKIDVYMGLYYDINVWL